MGEQTKREIEVAGGLGLAEEVRGPFVIWTLDRPDRRNALSRALVREMGKRARALRQRKEIRALIITGQGDRAFCAGADLKERRSMDEEDVRDFLPLYRASFGAIDSLPVPVVAALNGAAYGGGLELALACDFRVAAREAALGLTETSLGIIPGAGGTQRLSRLIGGARAKELIVFARRLSAQEAFEIGLINRVAAPGQSALECALDFVGPLADAAPIAIAAALEAVDAAAELPLEAGLSKERECYERTLESRDRLEALQAFAEKRKPVFHGV